MRKRITNPIVLEIYDFLCWVIIPVSVIVFFFVKGDSISVKAYTEFSENGGVLWSYLYIIADGISEDVLDMFLVIAVYFALLFWGYISPKIINHYNPEKKEEEKQ